MGSLCPPETPRSSSTTTTTGPTGSWNLLCREKGQGAVIAVGEKPTAAAVLSEADPPLPSG
jgi:precorrin isomerase